MTDLNEARSAAHWLQELGDGGAAVAVGTGGRGLAGRVRLEEEGLGGQTALVALLVLAADQHHILRLRLRTHTHPTITSHACIRTSTDTDIT